MMKTIHSFLERSAERFPDKEALVFGERRLTYSDVNRISGRISGFLCTKTRKHDAVAILLENSVEFICYYFGILKAGCICVPVDINTSNENLLFKVRNSGSRVVVSREKFLDKIKRSGILEHAEYIDAEKEVPDHENHMREVSPEDICSIMYTSGTMGEPKSVMLKHKNVVAATENIVQFIGMGWDDTDVNALPYTHSFGLGNVHCYFRQGGRIVIQRNFINLNELLDKIINERATSFSAPPAILKLLVDNFPEKLAECGKYLRYVVSNTNFMPKETSLPLMDLLANTRIYMYYGLTEASRSSFNLYNENREKVESIGKPAPNVEIIVADDEMKSLPFNHVGEIMIRGRHVVDGYWKNPDETSKFFSNGWLKTGDMGYFDPEGYLWIVGRKDHMINVAGQKVSPLEIERVICSFPGVKEAAAIGAAHSVLGNVVKIYVVRDSEISQEDLIRFCKSRLENYKIPRLVEFVDSLPKTETGKVRRSFLR